jgi:hypothetical protein
MNEEHLGEPQLSADFAQRVLELADRRQARHRRLRWVSTGAISAVAVVAVTSWFGFEGSRQADPPRNPQLTSLSAPSDLAQPRTESAEPLSYFFPDAEPLARFAAEDGSDDSGSRDSAEGLFADQE